MLRRLIPMVLVVGCSGPVEMPPPPDPDPFLIVQRKTVTAQQPAPDVMFLVDRSAASALPSESGLLGTTRFDDVQAQLHRLLTEKPDFARWGFSVFPGESDCAAGEQLLPIGSNPVLIDGWIRALPKFGQAPIAASLSAVGTFADPRHEDFIILLTASEPGCGGDAVAAVKALREKQIRTVVVGYGPDVAHSAALHELALAGGFQRTCPMGTDAECGSDTCDPTSNVCSTAYYAAPDRRALGHFIDQTFTGLSADSICKYRLEASVPSDRITVLVDGVKVDVGWPDGWTSSGDQLEFLGATCAMLNGSSADRPVTVELRIDTRP